MAESLPEVVAHHFTEAGLASEAIAYWLKAGRLASARSANREAVSSFERALSLLETLPESRSTLEQRCDIRLELRPVLLELGRSARMLECLREAEALADRLNDDRRRGLVYGFMTVVHSLAGEIDQALAAGSRALAVAGRLGDLRLRIVTTSLLVQVHHAAGHYDQVIELATGNLAALPADWVHETSRTWRASIGLGSGLPDPEPRRAWPVRRSRQLRSRDDPHRRADPARFYHQHGPVRSERGPYAQGRLGPGAVTDRALGRAGADGKFSFHLPWGVAASAWPMAQLGEARGTEPDPGSRGAARASGGGPNPRVSGLVLLLAGARLSAARPA